MLGLAIDFLDASGARTPLNGALGGNFTAISEPGGLRPPLAKILAKRYESKSYRSRTAR